MHKTLANRQQTILKYIASLIRVQCNIPAIYGGLYFFSERNWLDFFNPIRKQALVFNKDKGLFIVLRYWTSQLS
jgi:hypothetical protein